MKANRLVCCQQLKYSQNFLLKEIQRLKTDLDANYTKLNYANELRTIDQRTLKTFQTKFHELNQILTNVKSKELDTWHTVQTLRATTSRLWHIFETVTGLTISQELVYEDLQKLLNLTELEKDEQTANLTLIEKEHASLLLKVKEIQISLEQFRTDILQTTQDINETNTKVKTQQQINDYTHEQSTRRINDLLANVKDVQTLLINYKSISEEIQHILKLIFQVQTYIEMHHKSTIVYQVKLNKYKQDLTFLMISRTKYKSQLSNLLQSIQQQDQQLEQLEFEQIQVVQHRQLLHDQIRIIDKEKTQMSNNQQEILETIKQAMIKARLLKTSLIHSKHDLKDLQYSYRQLTTDHRKQQELTHTLQKSITIHDQRLDLIKNETNKLTNQIHRQNDQIHSHEHQISFVTKELSNLEHYQSIIHAELQNQHRKVNESKTKVLSYTQKIHKLSADERPVIKEISHYQQQLAHHAINHRQLEMGLKQNEAKIPYYKMISSKLTSHTKDFDRILMKETGLLQQYQVEGEKTRARIKIFNDNLQQSEHSYQDLKGIFSSLNNENMQLQQEYERLSFVLQLLGEKHTIVNNQLPFLYNGIKRLTEQNRNKAKIIEQLKSDLNLLRKYYHYLQASNNRLQQSMRFQSQQRYECTHSQYVSHRYTNLHNQLEVETKNNSNEVHHWQRLKVNSPVEFGNLSKLYLTKKKLVKKYNELFSLKRLFYEKQTLCHYFDQIYIRRKKLTS
ncbi:unnamed protein product [Adineta ricciae]|uniref:Uncharacterized protein n=1 Tax=Adineta ricciae TaxID=249248 RepID=A0A814EFZ9_ADIRI|nr:unnamed protein product [Adineta ricciae]CAF1102612.1 unnamed protein product [Adineta ricciae]